MAGTAGTPGGGARPQAGSPRCSVPLANASASLPRQPGIHTRPTPVGPLPISRIHRPLPSAGGAADLSSVVDGACL